MTGDMCDFTESTFLWLLKFSKAHDRISLWHRICVMSRNQLMGLNIYSTRHVGAHVIHLPGLYCGILRIFSDRQTVLLQCC